MHTRVIACLLCLTVLAGMVRAQESSATNSDRLKKKIDSVSLIYKQTLKRHYEELISSLDKDIEGLKKLRDVSGTTTEEVLKINAYIERFTRERADAVETARALEPELRKREVAAQPTPSPTPSTVVAQLPCGCPGGEEKAGEDAQKRLERVKKTLPAGVIWCGSAAPPEVSVLTLAQHAAPILWFSPNEPLIFENKKLPEPLPGDDDDKDPQTRAPVVYYKITEVVLNDGVRKSEVDPAIIRLDEIKRLALKYYFYYSEDRGFRRHRHDLESVRLDINFTLRNKDGYKPTAPGNGSYYVAHISRVIGAAHGVTWYANQLNIGNDERDTSLPITLLVEEGKHATSPDRNADGFYSPGYDVNFRYTDAWGVRDLLGSGNLGSAQYEGAMTKPRRPKDIIKLRPDESHKLVEAARSRRRVQGLQTETHRPFKLSSGDRADSCAGEHKVHLGEKVAVEKEYLVTSDGREDCEAVLPALQAVGNRDRVFKLLRALDTEAEPRGLFLTTRRRASISVVLRGIFRSSSSPKPHLSPIIC